MSQLDNCCLIYFAFRLAFYEVADRGKSGLQRAECQVTPGGYEPTASATENKPPSIEISDLNRR